LLAHIGSIQASDAAQAIGIIKDGLQSAAIVVGACWAYLKFFRGRTFARRAELRVQAIVLSHGSQSFVKAIVTLLNCGLTKIPFAPRRNSIYLYGLDSSKLRPGANINWQRHLILTPIFSSHEWVEAQETITDEVLIPLPPPAEDDRIWLAYKLHAEVWGKKRMRPWKSSRWIADSVIANGAIPVQTSIAELIPTKETDGKSSCRQD
jgi:hypothetical protein